MGSIRGGTQKKGLRCPLPAAGNGCQGSLLGVELGTHRGGFFPVTNSLSITELFAITSFQRDPHFAISLPCPGLDFFLIRAPKCAEFGTKLFCALSRPQSRGGMPAAHEPLHPLLLPCSLYHLLIHRGTTGTARKDLRVKCSIPASQSFLSE